MKMLRKVIRIFVPLPVRYKLVRWLHTTQRYIASHFVGVLAGMISKYADPVDAYKAFYKHERFLIPKDFTAPIPDEQDIVYADRESEMVGVEIDEVEVFEFLKKVIHPFKQEFSAFPVHSNGEPTEFYLANGFFMAVDGNVYYGLIRHYKPQRIIEIGSGNSTLLASAAVRRNVAEGGSPSVLTCIEPYPKPFLRAGVPGMWDLIEKRVQAVDLSVFEVLESGDILFIDSSHVLRAGNDVWWEYCEILPRLKPGVLVHIHDIALPNPYDLVYYHRQTFWNEQYLLQAFLTYNSRFEVIWPGAYMYSKHRDRMDDYFQPEFDQMRSVYSAAGAASFWMRVREER